MRVALWISVALAALLPATPLLLSAGCESAPLPCPSGFLDCDHDLATGTNGCETSVTSDPKNCGNCGVACSGICSDSSCGCVTGLTMCDGTCVDTLTDAMNCGTCARTCASPTTCSGAVCVCPGGKAMCPSAPFCPDTMTDPMNCGGCGTTCPAGATCKGGGCVCPGAGQAACGSSCVDTTSDPSNCGGCGNPCPGGATCSDSQCVCPGSEVVCGNACTDTSTDPANCGGCNQPCSKLNEVCTGTCTCPMGNCTCDLPQNGGVCDLSPQCGCTAPLACYLDGMTGHNVCLMAGTVPLLGTCATDSDCVPGAGCIVYPNMGATASSGFCKQFCQADGDCSGTASGRCTSTSTAGVKFCEVVCDPAHPTSPTASFQPCPANAVCWTIGSTSDCLFPSGNSVAGGPCTHLWDCAPGFYCDNGGVCKGACESDGDCPGSTCNFSFLNITLEGVKVGGCN